MVVVQCTYVFEKRSIEKHQTAVQISLRLTKFIKILSETFVYFTKITDGLMKIIPVSIALAEMIESHEENNKYFHFFLLQNSRSNCLFTKVKTRSRLRDHPYIT